MQDQRWDQECRRLLDEVAAEFAATAPETGVERMSVALHSAMAGVPRHRFVPEPWRELAYENRPLPIGHGQTISQPFIVALMTALLELAPGDRVLEIGTGCGYQAAVLARLAARVTSVEIVPELSRRAAQTLAELGIANVDLHIADGRFGWPEAAPYDAIIATAAPHELPPAWLAQLAPGGRLVAPVGDHDEAQWLHLVRNDATGQVSRQRTIAVRFVPLVAAADAPPSSSS
jgi:protein-L-isoaspartate(D-aspartate) O-methyltransferase